MMKKLILLFFCTFLISSCESYNQDDYMELIVLESYAVANRPLPAVYVSLSGK